MSAGHLSAIHDVMAAGEVLGNGGEVVWLRGGWAMDFAIGRVTRPHADIDVFVDEPVWRAVVEALIDQGWVAERFDWQADLTRDGVDLSLNAIAHRRRQAPRVVGGPWAGEPWPATTLVGAGRGVIDDVEAAYVSVASQIECKVMMPQWTGRPVRAKDVADVELLRQYLAEA